MTFEWLVLAVFGSLLAFSILKRVIWLAVVSVIIATLLYFNVFEYLYLFVKSTLLETPDVLEQVKTIALNISQGTYL